jgi:hypothetical protein
MALMFGCFSAAVQKTIEREEDRHDGEKSVSFVLASGLK